ncbi:formate dehydrogenase accessory sulfurtransferase FdhD [Microbacterium sp. CCNWLW134]|uniref:formate dehydrogenase accessory sulfurtransferase FdhD n=1 Tax=Microbacterium sp. CCNWLW134 TaxID=3122064 RepID=UPI0030100508
MGRITARRPVTRVTIGGGEGGTDAARRRPDALAVEEPLEIRVRGTSLAVTMRTPGHDVELAAGFLVSEGVISRGDQFRSAIHCGGPGTGRLTGGMPGGMPGATASFAGSSADGNTYNVLDVSLAPDVPPLDPDLARNFYTTSSCGLCGKASIDAVRTVSSYDIALDQARVPAAMLSGFPDELRRQQDVFDKTGGLHAAALFDAATGEALVVREDVGRHNAVDKVVGWAVLNDRLPLAGTVLQVSGRASFELVQKAVMAGIPILAAVSAPSSLAVELAEDSGLTLVGFLRGASMNVYTHPDRILLSA